MTDRSNTGPAARIEASISLRTWLGVTGPVFAAMTLGFGILWNGQQTLGANMLAMQDSFHTSMRQMQESTHAQLLELTRTTGRLEATTERLEGAIDRLDTSVQELRDEVGRLSERVDRLEG